MENGKWQLPLDTLGLSPASRFRRGLGDG